MRRVRRRDTSCELAVRTRIHALGLRYRVDSRPVADLNIRADLIFSKLRLAIFIDGCFWHSCPMHQSTPKANGSWWMTKLNANRERDDRANSRLRDYGWTVLRFWEHEDPDEVARSVLAKVTQLRHVRGA